MCYPYTIYFFRENDEYVQNSREETIADFRAPNSNIPFVANSFNSNYSGAPRHRRATHVTESYRRFGGSNRRHMPYLPHQWLYNRQQVMQEAYRRHMFDSIDSMVYENRYLGSPYERRRENQYGIAFPDRSFHNNNNNNNNWNHRRV